MSIEVMNAVWRQSQSTGRARLVLLAIADHQGEIGAWPSIATLARMVNASERSVQRDIQELVELGELEVHVQAAPSRGQYKSNLYWVTLPGVPHFEAGVTDRDSGVTENASGVTPVGALNLIEPLKNPNLKYPQAELEDAFNEFWSIYPRKVEKIAARKAFTKAVKVASVAEVLDGARRLASDPWLPLKQFIPYPASWLNAGGWTNEPYPERVLTKEEQREKERRLMEERKARDKANHDLLMAEAQKAKEEAEANPPRLCEHNRVAVICQKCQRA